VATGVGSDCRRRRCRPSAGLRRGRADQSIARSAPCGAAAPLPLRGASRPRVVRPTGPTRGMTRADNPMIDGRGTRPSRVGSPVTSEAGQDNGVRVGSSATEPATRELHHAKAKHAPWERASDVRQPSPHTLTPARPRAKPAQERSGWTYVGEQTAAPRPRLAATGASRLSDQQRRHRLWGRRGSQPCWECPPTGSQLGRSSASPHRSAHPSQGR
jgi:hypothetical protein